MEKIKKNKGSINKIEGITLIALVITIIVLLILAGVSIASLTGENGILKQAQNAKDKTKLVDKDEREKLDKMNELVDETVNMESKVEQVTDEHPGELENVGNEKIINSIEDLIFFAYNITNGNTYEGQTVKLGLSLDFNSSKSYVDPYTLDYKEYGYNGELKTLLNERGFIPIGKITRLPEEEKNSIGFKGTFDGNNCKIYNLKIDQNINLNESYVSLGFFSVNNGKIKNLCIEKSKFNIEIATNKFHAVGRIVGYVSDGSKLIDSYSVGFITCKETVDDVFACTLGYSYGDIGNIATNCYYLKETINSSQSNNIFNNFPAVRF